MKFYTDAWIVMLQTIFVFWHKQKKNGTESSSRTFWPHCNTSYMIIYDPTGALSGKWEKTIPVMHFLNLIFIVFSSVFRIWTRIKEVGRLPSLQTQAEIVSPPPSVESLPGISDVQCRAVYSVTVLVWLQHVLPCTVLCKVCALMIHVNSSYVHNRGGSC